MPKKTQDLVGRKFSRLTVLERGAPVGGKTVWLCRCDCGNLKSVLAKALLNGSTKSCGCLHREQSRNRTFIDISGRRIGQLTVLREDMETKRPKTKSSNAYWVCLCDCGKTKTICGASLRNGTTKSCGCARIKKITKPLGVAAFNDVMSRTKKEAETRGVKWALTEKEVAAIHIQDCFYCGAPPSNRARMTRGNGGYVYNGIDRFDNNVGYEAGNVVPCCKQCNRSKSDMPFEDFKRWISMVNKKLELGGNNNG